MIIAMICGTIFGIVVPLLTAKQIVYITSSLWKQVLIISLIIFGVQVYISFAAAFLQEEIANILQEIQ